jgi:hypothetical protein
MSPGCDLLLVAEDALEGAGELRDEDGDGVVTGFQSGFLITCFPLRKVRNKIKAGIANLWVAMHFQYIILCIAIA